MSFFKDLTLHMDFQGQKKAEKIFQIIVSIFAVIGFFWGYIEERISISIYLLASGFLLSILLTVPAWPIYRRNQLNWQKVKQ